jgi:hypothetical protein
VGTSADRIVARAGDLHRAPDPDPLRPGPTLARGPAYIDLFTCRADTDPDHAIAPIIEALSGYTLGRQRINRSTPDNATAIAQV